MYSIITQLWHGSERREAGRPSAPQAKMQAVTTVAGGLDGREWLKTALHGIGMGGAGM